MSLEVYGNAGREGSSLIHELRNSRDKILTGVLLHMVFEPHFELDGKLNSLAFATRWTQGKRFPSDLAESFPDQSDRVQQANSRWFWNDKSNTSLKAIVRRTVSGSSIASARD